MKASLVVLLLAAAVCLTQARRFRSDGCPEPYDRLDETRCILADSFVSRTMNDSLAFCKTHSGHLLYIEDCVDQTLVLDYIHSEVGLAGKVYWVAASDNAEEGTWVWEHSKKPVPMGNPLWHYNQPSASTSNNCIQIHPTYDYRFLDANCNSKHMAICLRAV
ncbi:Perlucin-like protein [Chionoecetes opilio]|uniref:Perlucin-like protein n=1 Tax=Chionoecetes opilio TaxID=41210 RepID=A0A8J4Y868_CHIOP|nr:Perlucin-like protein [Chionoecetes opilio]